MPYPSRELRFVPEDRLYEFVWEATQLAAMISGGGLAAANTRFGNGSSVFVSPLLDSVLCLPLTAAVEHCVRDLRPLSIAIEIGWPPGWTPPPPDPENEGGPSQFYNLYNNAGSVAFVNFYEGHKSWIKDRFGDKVSQWPSLFQFAWLVRNCASHGGRVHFFEWLPFFRCEWQGLSYSRDNNGDLVIGETMFFPEMVILMIEVGDEIDRLELAAA